MESQSIPAKDDTGIIKEIQLKTGQAQSSSNNDTIQNLLGKRQIQHFTYQGNFTTVKINFGSYYHYNSLTDQRIDSDANQNQSAYEIQNSANEIQNITSKLSSNPDIILPNNLKENSSIHNNHKFNYQNTLINGKNNFTFANFSESIKLPTRNFGITEISTYFILNSKADFDKAMNCIVNNTKQQNQMRKQMSSYKNSSDPLLIRFDHLFYHKKNLIIVKQTYVDNGKHISEIINNPFIYFSKCPNLISQLIQHLRNTYKKSNHANYKGYGINLLGMTFKESKHETFQFQFEFEFENCVFEFENSSFDKIFENQKDPIFNQELSLESELPQFFRPTVEIYEKNTVNTFKIAYCISIFLMKIFHIIPNIISNEDFGYLKNDNILYFNKIKEILYIFSHFPDNQSELSQQITSFLFLTLSLQIEKIDVIENGLKFLETINLDQFLNLILKSTSFPFPLKLNFYENEKKQYLNSQRKESSAVRLTLNRSNSNNTYNKNNKNNKDSTISENLLYFYSIEDIRVFHDTLTEEILFNLTIYKVKEKTNLILNFLEATKIVNPSFYYKFFKHFQFNNFSEFEFKAFQNIIIQNLDQLIISQSSFILLGINSEILLYPENEVNQIDECISDSSKYLELLQEDNDIESLPIIINSPQEIWNIGCLEYDCFLNLENGNDER